MITGHGGNLAALAGRLDCRIADIVDMSSNINPLGPPDRINEILGSHLADIRALPDPDASRMTRAFCSYHDIDPSRVAPGNGTTFFIFTLPLALGARNALILGPTYSDYRDGCGMHKCEVEHFTALANDHFEFDLTQVSGRVKGKDMVFICNPNNPTGRLVDKAALTGLIAAHPDTVFLVDESYLPFVDHAHTVSLLKETRFDNLVVLSSMSKIFTIPGLRTGFLVGHEQIIQKVMAYFQPWSVNSLAQTVIREVFENPDFIEPFYSTTRAYVAEERELFGQAFHNDDRITLYESCASFILAKLETDMGSSSFCERVGNHKILIRDCENFDGLDHQFVRFSLKTRERNQRLIQVVQEVLNHA